MRYTNKMVDGALKRLNTWLPLPKGETFRFFYAMERSGAPIRPRLYLMKDQRSITGKEVRHTVRAISPRCSNGEMVAYIDAMIEGAQLYQWSLDGTNLDGE